MNELLRRFEYYGFLFDVITSILYLHPKRLKKMKKGSSGGKVDRIAFGKLALLKLVRTLPSAVTIPSKS